jgi:hypothetical protein
MLAMKRSDHSPRLYGLASIFFRMSSFSCGLSGELSGDRTDGLLGAGSSGGVCMIGGDAAIGGARRGPCLRSAGLAGVALGASRRRCSVDSITFTGVDCEISGIEEISRGDDETLGIMSVGGSVTTDGAGGYGSGIGTFTIDAGLDGIITVVACCLRTTARYRKTTPFRTTNAIVIRYVRIVHPAILHTGSRSIKHDFIHPAQLRISMQRDYEDLLCTIRTT